MAQEWHYLLDGKQKGPISEDALKQLAIAGKLKSTDLVWKQGMSQWVAASSVKGMFQTASVPVATLATPLPHSSGQNTIQAQDGKQTTVPSRSLSRKAIDFWRGSRSPVKAGIFVGATLGVFLVVLLFCVLLLNLFFERSAEQTARVKEQGGFTVTEKAKQQLEAVPIS